MESHKDVQTQPRQGPGPVMRVRVQYRDGRWQVIKRVRVPEMTVPASQPPPQGQRPTGFWFEAVDAQGRVLYRHRLRTPIRGVEIFEEDGTIRRVDAEIEGYTQDLLVPLLPRLEKVRLYYAPPTAFAPSEAEAQKPPERGKPTEVFEVYGGEIHQTGDTEQQGPEGGQGHGKR